MYKLLRSTTILVCMLCAVALGQEAIPAEVDFSAHLRAWDGFGVNYVEVAQTLDYETDPQEYGGFSLLSEQERREIVDLVFGEDGLKPGLVKLFLDPWHQSAPDAPFDHETSTRWMRHFVREGLATTRARGGDLTMITTLYGPPPWATQQRFLRGRDLDPARKEDLARYLIDWVRYLREDQDFPVKYLSLHNEGEAKQRWPEDGASGNIGKGHDYNLYWPPTQVVDFLRFLRPMMDAAGLAEVGITPGETTKWLLFHDLGYAQAIAEDPVALHNLGLITSHGFYSDKDRERIGPNRSQGTELLRSKRPELHAWVTSTSWSKMDVFFLREMYENIYVAGANGIIPWACIQRPPQWVGGDPNPGCAFEVTEDGDYQIQRGYYYYKQICRAGQPGMAVAKTSVGEDTLRLIAFARNASAHPDAFLILNLSDDPKSIAVRVRGTEATTFGAFRTSDAADRYAAAGTFPVVDGVLRYEVPALSATTFYGKE